MKKQYRKAGVMINITVVSPRVVPIQVILAAAQQYGVSCR